MRATLLAGALMALVAAAAPVSAQAPPADENPCAGAIACTVTVPGGGGGGGTGLPPGYDQTPQDGAPIWGPAQTGVGELSGLPPGSRCWAAVQGAGGMTRLQAEAAASGLATLEVPVCPADNAFNEAAVRIDAEAQVPRARPKADPGKAFTGLPVYLEFGLSDEPVVAPLELSTPLPPGSPQPVLTATVTRWEVRWEPARAWQEVDGPGVPYERRDEGGAVTHRYRTPGTEECAEGAGNDCITISVRVTWRLQVAGLPVAVDYPYTAPAESFQLRVGEVQAVRRR